MIRPPITLSARVGRLKSQPKSKLGRSGIRPTGGSAFWVSEAQTRSDTEATRSNIMRTKLLETRVV